MAIYRNTVGDGRVSSLPFGVYYWVMVALMAAGLLDAVYLSVSHYQVYTDIGYKSFCAVSRSINCDTVSQSPYSIFLGIPVPVWGIFGYAFVGWLLLLAGSRPAKPTRMWGVVFFTTLTYSLYSLVLAFISSYYIHSYCLMCIVSYAINLLLLYYSWLIIRRFVPEGFFTGLKNDIRFLSTVKRNALLLLIPLLAIACLTWAMLPNYWLISADNILKDDIPQGVTEDGFPWLGSEHPALIITEFSDYLCFQCRKMHYFLRQLMAENPGKIQLIHRHFPMEYGLNPAVNEPFHTGSGPMAQLAIYATEAGKFREMNDLLFEMAGKKQNLNTKDIAERLNIIDSREIGAAVGDRRLLKRLQRDIRDGLKLGISGTPGFVIDGAVYQGYIPPEVIEKAIE